jgi:hypothetical protein
MAILKINLHECHQISQTYGSNDPAQDHLSAEVLFDIEDEQRKRYQGMTATVSDPWGSRFEEEPFEVGPPVGPYNGPFDWAAFSENIEKYMRRLIGPQGSGFQIIGSASEVVMTNNCVQQEMTFEIEVDDHGPAY